MERKVILLLADGFEEIEALTPVDFLRRAGAEVLMSSIGESRTVTGSHGIPVLADRGLSELASEGILRSDLWDAVLVPGGMPGASNVAASEEAGAFLKDMASRGKLVAAICAAPAVVLGSLGILEGKRFTCYPGMENRVRGASWSDERVVADGAVITSRGPGTAAEWAIEIIRFLAGDAMAEKIAADTLQR